MAKLCYNRHDDGAYLQTCYKPAEHPGAHEGDNDSTWTDEEGWWDIHGDQPQKAKVCACDRYVVGVGDRCQTCIDRELYGD